MHVCGPDFGQYFKQTLKTVIKMTSRKEAKEERESKETTQDQNEKR